MEQASLGARTMRGAVWAYGSYGLGRVLVLIVTAVLARLLTPAEFGLVALAILATSVLDSLAKFGVTEALIVAPPERTENQARTAFAFTMGTGVLMAGVTVALSPLAASFFDEDGLKTLMPLMALTFPLRALGSVHYALAQKNIDFRSRTAAELADVIARGVVGISAAISGAGAYSLVAGYLAGTVAMVIVLWIMVDWRPRRPTDGYDIRALVGFGGALSALDLMGVIVSNADYLLIGRVLGTEQLGLYTLAYRLPEMLILNVAAVAGQVLYPAFASLDAAGMRRAFLVTVRSTATVCMPIAAVLAGFAAPLIAIAFGSQWNASVAPMRVLTVYAFSKPMSIPSGIALKAMRKAGILLKLGVPRSVLTIALMVWFVDDGIVAVAACQAGAGVLFGVIGLIPAARLVGTRPREIIGAVIPSLVASLVLLGVGLAATELIEGDVLSLLIGLPIGLLAWFGVMMLVAREHLRDLRRRLEPLTGGLRRRGAAPPPAA